MVPGPKAALGANRPRTRRRWPHALGALAVLLSVAYASLPAWLPTGWLARRIECQLAGELQRPVTIGRLHVGWAEGVVIEDLAIGDLPDSPNPHLARVQRLRCDFTPVLTLATGRVDQLEVTGPQVWLVRDADGRLNIEKLPKRQGGRLPALSYQVNTATCHVWTPQARQVFRVDTLHCRVEPERALLDINGCATVTTGRRLGFHARLTVPKLRKDRELSLSGAVRVEWADVALTDLPLSLVPALPVEQVGGTTSGMLSFETRSDLSIDFKQWIEVQGVRLMWAGLDRPAIVPDAVLHCDGRWEPQDDCLTISELDYETQAVRMKGADRPAVRIDPRGDLSFELGMAGHIKSWELLRREVPQMDSLAESLGVELAGQERFKLKASCRGDQGQLELALDGGRSRWALSRGDRQVFEAAEAVPKKLELVAAANLATRRVKPSIRLSLGDLLVSLTAEGCLPGGRASRPPQASQEVEQAANSPEEWLASLAANLELHTGHIEQVVALFPPAMGAPELAEWRGPMHAKIKVAPASNGSRLDFNLVADTPAAFGWHTWFQKPPGQPLSVTAGATIPHEAEGRIDDLAFIARYAAGSIQVEPGQAHAHYHFQNDGDFNLNIAIPARTEHVEDLAGLCPKWNELTSKGARDVSGSVSIATRVEAFRRPAEAMASFKADIDARSLAAQWDDALTKPGGEPLAVRLVGHSQSLGETRENWLGVAVKQPAGEFEATLAQTAGSSEGSDSGFEQCTLDVRVSDFDKLLQGAPALAERLREYRAAGSAEAHVNAIASNGRCSVDLSVDARGTEVTLPGEKPGSKPAGVPAGASLRWESEPAEAGSGGAWKLVSGQARLAGLTVTEMTGQVVGNGNTRNGPKQGRSPRLMQALETLQQVSAAHLQLKGSAACELELEKLYPGLAHLRERLGLSGSITWETEVSGNSEALRFASRLDANDLAWSASTGQPAAPTVRKPARVPASLAVELAAVRGPDGPQRRIDARVDANIDGNRLRADGHALMTGLREGVPQVGDLELLTSLALDNPQRLLHLAPGTLVKAVEGSGAIELGLERRGETARLTGIHASFQNLAITSDKSAIALNGSGSWEPAGARVPGLEWKCGNSGGKIDGQVSFLPGGVQGRIGLATDRLDVSDLQRQFAAWTGRFATTAPATAPATQPDESDRLMRSALAFLARSELRVDGQVGKLEVVLPPGIPVRGDTVIHSLQAGRGPLSFTFAGTVEGGAVQGRVETLADAADPRMRLTYTAERITPGPLVDAYLRQTFPGMTATGPLTLIDESNQKLLPAPGELNGPTGTGELIIYGGRVVGRAAPKAITRIFPGLNLASFDFSYMHSWFRKEVTGRIYHQMIYQGRYYNIYMNGYGEPSGFRYEVGVDFLADFNSKYWAESGQGRIPMFTKTGRIRPDGSIENEEVVYMPERFFDTVLVKNNPVFTAYHAVRKRVREEK